MQGELAGWASKLTSLMASLHYLTVQDILWINLQTTRRVNHFNYARLEEATFYQYAYGDSNSLLPQAGRFVSGFLRMHPFDEGNESTMLVAAAAFLVINGGTLTLSDHDAEGWVRAIADKSSTGAQAVARLGEIGHGDDHHDHDLAPREAISRALVRFSCTLKALNPALED